MANGLPVDEQALIAEVADDLPVGFLDPLPLEHRNIRGEAAIRPYRRGQRNLVGVPVGGHRPAMQIVIHFAKGRRLVDETGPLVELHEIGGKHPPERRNLRTIRENPLQVPVTTAVVVERRPVAASDEFLGGQGAALRKRTPEPLLQISDQRVGEDQAARVPAFVRVLDLGVGDSGADRGIEIRGQRPGSGGPDDERRARIVFERQRHMDRRILHLAVAEADFRRGKCGASLGPPPDHLLAAVEEILAVEFGKRPPDAFDIAPPIGHIGLFEVHPVPDPGGHLLPVADVAEHTRHAPLHEAAHSVLFDLFPAVDPELPLHLDLDREAVGIPPGDPLGEPAAHRLVPREHVLEHPGQHVAVVGAAVGSRRAVVPDPGRASRPGGDAALEDAALAPETGDLRLGSGDFTFGAGGPKERQGSLRGSFKARGNPEPGMDGRVPNGTRTRVFAVKGRRPGPLDDGDPKGRPCRLRTCDISLKRRALCRLS